MSVDVVLQSPDSTCSSLDNSCEGGDALGDAQFTHHRPSSFFTLTASSLFLFLLADNVAGERPVVDPQNGVSYKHDESYEQLLTDLDSYLYQVRQKAMLDLQGKKSWTDAEIAKLVEKVATGSLEVQWRAADISKSIPSDRIEDVLMEVLERAERQGISLSGNSSLDDLIERTVEDSILRKITSPSAILYLQYISKSKDPRYVLSRVQSRNENSEQDVKVSEKVKLLLSAADVFFQEIQDFSLIFDEASSLGLISKARGYVEMPYGFQELLRKFATSIERGNVSRRNFFQNYAQAFISYGRNLAASGLSAESVQEKLIERLTKDVVPGTENDKFGTYIPELVDSYVELTGQPRDEVESLIIDGASSLSEEVFETSQRRISILLDLYSLRDVPADLRTLTPIQKVIQSFEDSYKHAKIDSISQPLDLLKVLMAYNRRGLDINDPLVTEILEFGLIDAELDNNGFPANSVDNIGTMLSACVQARRFGINSNSQSFPKRLFEDYMGDEGRSKEQLDGIASYRNALNRIGTLIYSRRDDPTLSGFFKYYSELLSQDDYGKELDDTTTMLRSLNTNIIGRKPDDIEAAALFIIKNHLALHRPDMGKIVRNSL